MIQTTFCNYQEDIAIFKDYILKGLLGKGRYGHVYLVENRARKRALKIFNHNINWEGDKKKIINDFQSPYMVDIIDYGETILGQSCMLMEYLPLSLEQALGQAIGKGVEFGQFSKFTEHKTCLYFTDILKGLQLQEMYGIIHRDIKPSNLFIVADTIKAGDHAFISSDTDTSEAFGTPAYSAPEVFDGCYSHSADRWAAAVVFFQMLAGSLPFDGETILNIMLAIMDSEPDYTLIPPKYRHFLEKCFKKNPRDRYADVEKMLSDFEDCLISDSVNCKIAMNPETEILSHQSKSTSATPLNSIFIDDSSFLNNQIWRLRKTSVTISEDESKLLFALDESGHPFEYVQNCYEANDNGTVMDHATGLMWQQSGSENNFPYQAALDYIANLNTQSFAGYSDWRVPTIAELLSLIEPEKINGYLHISPLFDGKQQWCWSSDKRTKSSGWYVFFYSGNVNWDFLDLDNYVRGVRL